VLVILRVSVVIVCKCLFHFTAFDVTIVAAVLSVPVPLPRQRHHEKRVINGIIQTDVSSLPDSDQRSFGLLDNFISNIH